MKDRSLVGETGEKERGGGTPTLDSIFEQLKQMQILLHLQPRGAEAFLWEAADLRPSLRADALTQLLPASSHLPVKNVLRPR